MSVRAAIFDALLATELLPVAPLVEIIVRYTLPFRSTVSTLGPKEFKNPHAVDVWRRNSKRLSDANADANADAEADEYRIIVCDRDAACFKVLNSRCAAPILYLAGVPDFETGVRDVAFDPLSSNRIFVADQNCVRVLDCTRADTTTGVGSVLSTLAGHTTSGFADGSGTHARFDELFGLLCSGDGATLYVTDNGNNRVRAIEINTGVVRSVAGSGNSRNEDGKGEHASVSAPDAMAFDRLTAAPDTVMYVTAYDAIVRIELKTGDANGVVTDEPVWGPNGIACTASGLILFTSSATHSLQSLNPSTGHVQLIAGAAKADARGYANGSALSEAKFDTPYGIALHDTDHSVLVADAINGCVRRVTLPPEFFDTFPIRSSATESLTSI